MPADDNQSKTPPRSFNRRSFLRLTTATAGLSALGGCIGGDGGGSAVASEDAAAALASPTGASSSVGDSGTPSSPSSVPPLTPQPRTGQASLQIVLSSPVAQSTAPFCAGQTFRQGDIPSGEGVVASIPNTQVTIKNRWPDGSAKFAIVAGRANLGANTPLTVSLSKGAAAGGAALTEQDLRSTSVSAAIQFGGSAVELGGLIGTQSTYNAGARRWTPGRVAQWVSGPEMSSWIYYAPIGSDPHLAAWFEVRLWNGGQVEVLPWIENGYLLVAGPTTKSGTAVFTLNGTQRFSANLDIAHHTRTVLLSGRVTAYWAGNDPQVTARPNAAYLSASRLVPEYYGNTSAQSAVFNRLSTTYAPFARNNFPSSMGTAGYHESIGLIPEWDVAYLTSGADVRAHAAVLANGFSAGRYGIHYRDETTNRPIRFSSYPNLALSDANLGVSHNGTSSTNQYTPAAAGTTPPTWATSHHPSVGYMAYLLTGRWYFMEEVQFSATIGYLKQADSSRQFAKGILRTDAGSNTTRGAAWSLRTLIQAASVTPDDDTALRADLVTSFEENINHHHAKFVAKPNHPQGMCAPYSDYTAGDGKYEHAIWMEDFLTATWGYALDLKLTTSAASATRQQEFFNWKAQAVVGRLGGEGATEYNFRDAARYTIMVAPSDNADWEGGNGPWYRNWGEIYQATVGVANGPSADTAIRGGSFPDPTSYWGNMQPAIAYAVDHNVPNARLGYQRMATASNWSQIATGWNDDPVWGVRPRSV